MSTPALDRDQVLTALHACRGRAEGVSAKVLCGVLLGADASPAAERRLRMIVEELRLDGHPICAHPSAGYYFAETPEEIEEAIAFLHARAMTSLQQIARLRRVALPELLGQLKIEAADAR